ncbi:unnamed protein product [Fusarium graminearum]|nr:unnamed protein product [Fusarium graminearum]
MTIPVDLTLITLAQTATQLLTVPPTLVFVSVPWASTSVSALILSASQDLEVATTEMPVPSTATAPLQDLYVWMTIPVDLTPTTAAQILAMQLLTVLPMLRFVSAPWALTSVSVSIPFALFPAAVVMMAMPAQLMLTAQLLDQNATIVSAVRRHQVAQTLAMQPPTALLTLVFVSVPLVSTSVSASIPFALFLAVEVVEAIMVTPALPILIAQLLDRNALTMFAVLQPQAVEATVVREHLTALPTLAFASVP